MNCSQCKTPLELDYSKTRCPKCLEYSKNYQRLQRQKLSEKRLCVQCGVNKPRRNQKTCSVCFVPVPKGQARSKRVASRICIDCGQPRFSNTLRCKSCVQKVKERDRFTRLSLLASGICPKCKTNPIDGILQEKMCRPCRDVLNEKNTELRNSRLAAGLCRICGKEPACDVTACETCLLKNMAKRYFRDKNRWTELKDLLEEQQRKCAYTNIDLTVGRTASLDHILAKSKGGKDTIENFQWVHLWVNKMKNDRPHEEFLKSLRLFLQEAHSFVFAKAIG